MNIKHFVLATSLLASGAAIAQNTTTAGDLQVRPTVVAPGSILDDSHTPVHEEGPNAPISDRDVKPAGAAIDATSQRRDREQTLNAASPEIPLGNTRPVGSENIDEKVPMGANDNSYRPSSASGYYDNAIEEDRPLAPSVTPAPAATDPIRPAAPASDLNPPGRPY